MPAITLTRYECVHDRLPAVCVVCGEPATARKSRTYSWLAHRVVVRLPICDRHQGYWRRRVFVLLASGAVVFLLVAAVVGYVLSLPPVRQVKVADPLLIVCLIVMVVWLGLVLVLEVMGIRSGSVTDRSLRLAGLHKRFVAALLEERAGEKDEEQFCRTRFGDVRDDFDDQPGQGA
jgi:hypothetical protein